MKRLSILLVLANFLATLLAPHTGLAIGRKPKEGVPSDRPTVKPIQSKPQARDMQIATGQIKPISPDEEDSGK